MGGIPGLVVMGDVSCLRDLDLNPGIMYWMDIFSHIFVVKLYCLFEKTKKRLGSFKKIVIGIIQSIKLPFLSCIVSLFCSHLKCLLNVLLTILALPTLTTS